ncbi:MAG: hypothetical protein AB9869_33125 [Verrucomicrobiia bacterium]
MWHGRTKNLNANLDSKHTAIISWAGPISQAIHCSKIDPSDICVAPEHLMQFVCIRHCSDTDLIGIHGKPIAEVPRDKTFGEEAMDAFRRAWDIVCEAKETGLLKKYANRLLNDGYIEEGMESGYV